MHPEMIAGLPIWAAGLMIAGFAVLGAVAIELVARRVLPLRLREEHNAVASAMFAVIGTTYAVLLAFVAMLAWEGFNTARATAETEAALVEDVARLLDGLPAAQTAEMRDDPRAYARAVVAAEWPAQAAGQPISSDQPNLSHLIAATLRLRPDTLAQSNIQAALLADLGQLGRARRERLRLARTPIPAILWVVLVAGGGITVAFGSFLGAPSLRMHLAMSSMLALSGALVLLVIVALSNPFRGDFRVSAEPFEAAAARMATP